MQRHTRTIERLLLEAAERVPGAVVKAAEIGVLQGRTSAHLLKACPRLHLVMVDPWTTNPEYQASESPDSIGRWKLKDFENAYQSALRRTEFAKDRREVYRMTSAQAAPFQADNSLALVFLDPDHRKAVMAEAILMWWPKLIPQGILCIHDYGQRKRPGVTEAVDEWAGRRGVEIFTGAGHVWWVQRSP